MIIKRILGFLFLALAIMLSLAMLAQLPLIFKAITGLLRIFTGRLDAEQFGYSIGILICSGLFIGAAIALWIYGLKWVKRKRDIAE